MIFIRPANCFHCHPMNARLTAIERNGIKLKPKTMKNLITPFFIHYSYFFKIGNKFQNTTNFNRTKKYFQKIDL